MPTLSFRGSPLETEAGETVLDCLERHGIPVVSSCRSGVCQSCALRASENTRHLLVPRAQAGLKGSRRALGEFLSCQCPATDGLSIESTTKVVRAKVARAVPLGQCTTRIDVELEEALPFHAGQFVQLKREDGLARPYSIASLPGTGQLELHIGKVEGGVMSSWLAKAAGESLEVIGPQGDCIYLGDLDEPLLLAGTGTGLAPLVGVLRAALAAGHRAPIQLFHGATDPSGLYYVEELSQLSKEADNLTVRYSVLQEGAPESGIHGTPIDELVLSLSATLAEARIYLCGNPTLVQELRKKIFLAGASLDNIHSDPFVPAA